MREVDGSRVKVGGRGLSLLIATATNGMRGRGLWRGIIWEFGINLGPCGYI